MPDDVAPLNPALEQHTSMPPAVIEEIAEDPKAIEKIARAMAGVNLDNLFTLMRNPNVSVTQRIEFQRLLNDMGKLAKKAEESVGVQLPTVIINVQNGATTMSLDAPKVIDVTPVVVDE